MQQSLAQLDICVYRHNAIFKTVMHQSSTQQISTAFPSSDFGMAIAANEWSVLAST